MPWRRKRNGETPVAGVPVIPVEVSPASTTPGPAPQASDLWPSNNGNRKSGGWTWAQKLVGCVVGGMVTVFVAGWVAFARIDAVAANRVNIHATAIKPEDVRQDREILTLQEELKNLAKTVDTTRDDVKWLRNSFYLYSTGNAAKILPPPTTP